MDEQPVTVAEARRNGTAVMPFKTARVEFDSLGYAGWYAVVRTDPRSSIYDDLVSFGDRWWQAFGQIVLEWNLTDEDGNPHPLPKDLESEKDLDLRVGVITYLFRQFIDAVRAAADIPKASEPDSGSTSMTNGAVQKTG